MTGKKLESQPSPINLNPTESDLAGIEGLYSETEIQAQTDRYLDELNLPDEFVSDGMNTNPVVSGETQNTGHKPVNVPLQNEQPIAPEPAPNFQQGQIGPELSLRPANGGDLPLIWKLLTDHSSTFLDDHEELDSQQAIDMISNNELICITDNDYPIGLFRIYDRYGDVRAELSFLVDPNYIRPVLQQDIIGRFFDRAFALVGVKKFKSNPMNTQTTAIKFLELYRFRRSGSDSNETRKNGKLVHRFRFELQEHYWRKNRQTPIGEKVQRREKNHAVSDKNLQTSNPH